MQIPVWKTSGPIFVVGAGLDQEWPSDAAVATIVARMRANDRGTDVLALTYAKAGHYVGLAVPQFGYTDLFAAETEAAREDSWPRLLRFLSRL